MLTGSEMPVGPEPRGRGLKDRPEAKETGHAGIPEEPHFPYPQSQELPCTRCLQDTSHATDCMSDNSAKWGKELAAWRSWAGEWLEKLLCNAAGPKRKAVGQKCPRKQPASASPVQGQCGIA